jgi:hypothetical protein
MFRRQRGWIEVAQHDRDPVSAVPRVEHLDRDAGAMGEMITDRQFWRRPRRIDVLERWRLDEKLDEWPALVRRGEDRWMSLHSPGHRYAENRRLHLADLGQQMVDEIALIELLADRIRPGHDLQRRISEAPRTPVGGAEGVAIAISSGA